MDRIIRQTPVGVSLNPTFVPATSPKASYVDTTGRSQIYVSTPESGIRTGLFEYSQDVSESRAGVVRLLTKIHFPLRSPEKEDSNASTCCKTAKEAAFEDGITAHAVITLPAKYRKMLLTDANLDTSLSTEATNLSVPAQIALAALALADRLIGEYGQSPSDIHHAIVVPDSASSGDLSPIITTVSNGGIMEISASTKNLNARNVVSRILGLTK